MLASASITVIEPSKPSLRNVWAACMPASDAPTTTTEPITVDDLSGRAGRSLLDDRDRLLGATLDRLLDLGAQLLGRGLVQHVEEVVVAHLEHLWCDPHADRVALTQVVVDHHSHLGPLGILIGSEGPSCPNLSLQNAEW